MLYYGRNAVSHLLDALHVRDKHHGQDLALSGDKRHGVGISLLNEKIGKVGCSLFLGLGQIAEVVLKVFLGCFLVLGGDFLDFQEAVDTVVDYGKLVQFVSLQFLLDLQRINRMFPIMERAIAVFKVDLTILPNYRLSYGKFYDKITLFC